MSSVLYHVHYGQDRKCLPEGQSLAVYFDERLLMLDH